MPGLPIKAGGAGPHIPATRVNTVMAVSSFESKSGSVHAAPVRQRACPGTRASCEESFRFEHRPSFEDEEDRAGDLVREDGEGFGFAVTLGQSGAVELGRLVLAQEEHRGLGEGPLEVHVADLGAAGAKAFAARFLGRLDQGQYEAKSCTDGKRLMSWIS